MKKLAIIVCACSLFFVGCKNNNEVIEVVEDPVMEEQIDPEVEKCKAMCEAWQNWDQQTDEQKAELIAARKAKITELEAKKAECEAKKAECEAQKAEFNKTWAENWAKFDEMGIEEQKALIDNYMKFNCPKHGKCHEGQHQCQKKCESKCNGEGNCQKKCEGHQHGEGNCKHSCKHAE